MAKRKYVKENNLVKAINTDSLELQKPLVNEYYDINVHNSNMDKIDKGYKQNKNDISNINYELSKTENTKYTTANGIKEFECKDGYVDNVVIEGETLVNLYKKEMEYTLVNGIDSTGGYNTGDNYDFLIVHNITGVETFVYSEPINQIQLGKEYTLIVNVDEIRGGNFEIFQEDNPIYSGNSAGLVKIKFTSKHNSPRIRFDANELAWVKFKDIILLEGDYTDKPISYFEGLKSVGQGDKIEVLTQNSDETKQDKKQILTTLRSLPNGVKDTIEKRGNKYVKVQRCKEEVLNQGSNVTEIYKPRPNGVESQTYIRCQIALSSKPKTSAQIYCDSISSKHDYEAAYKNIFVHGDEYKSAFLTLPVSELNSLDEIGVKTWLKSNPITIVYELATPIIKELPNFNPQTFEGNTTLLLNSGAVQGEVSFEVTNSLGSELEVLKGKVSDLDDEVNPSKVDFSDRCILLNSWGMWGNNTYLSAYLHDNQVKICMLLTPGVKTAYTKMVKVPKEFAPINVEFITAITDGATPYSFSIDKDGYISSENTIGDCNWISINFSYPLPRK